MHGSVKMGIGRSLVALGALGLATTGRLAAQAPAPAAPSYAAITKTIDATRDAWSGAAPTEAAGWDEFFRNVRRELASYAEAKTSADRLAALGRVQGIESKLDGIAWAPAVELRQGLEDWLRPRLRLAEAERQLTDALAVGAGSPEDAANRRDWTHFVDDKLGGPLRDFEAASTVQERRQAGDRLRAALESLRKTASWPYAAGLLAAADALFNAPNLDVSADAASLYPVLSAQVVTGQPIHRGGYVSQVTPGPYAGFGLLASDQGIAFTNSQYMTSVTPITDFQQQVSRDPKGRRAAKLYTFNATSVDNGLLTVTAILTPMGVQLLPGASHNINANICSAPNPGTGLTRGVAALIGLNQRKVTDKVYDSAIGKIQQSVRQGAAEEASEKAAVAQADENAKLHGVLRGDGSAQVKEFEVEGLTLRSRPTNALIGGTVTWAGIPASGAEMPRPPRFATPNAGISADLNLPSVANNVIRGFLQSPQAADVQNLMIETKKVPPGTKPKDAVKVTKNVDFPTYLKAVDAADSANNPETQAIRIRKPAQPPEFAADARGDLVVIAHDLELDLPVPPQMANSPLGGAKAKIYRLRAKTAEFVFAIKPVTDANGAIRLTGNLVAFNPAPGSTVTAIDDDESKGRLVQPFLSVLIFQGFASAIRSKPLDVPLQNVQLKGYAITSISDLDPTGWMRVVLSPTGERPLEGTPASPANTSVTPTVAVADGAGG